MKDSDCYSFKLINQTDDPILKNVDLAIVLTMENSSRKFDDPVLLKLAKLTCVQINKGFKNKLGVNSATEDIIHAYKNVFKNTLNYNNIIIFEDDAVYNTKYSIDSFKSIDAFIKNNYFSIYSLGNLSIDLPDISDHRRILAGFGACHAVIYSPHVRKKLLNSTGWMYDVDILGNLPDKYKHKYPLVCQTFPETDSRKEWELFFRNFGALRGISLLNGDKKIEPFWSSMYLISNCIFYILLLIVILIVILIVRKML